LFARVVGLYIFVTPVILGIFCVNLGHKSFISINLQLFQTSNVIYLFTGGLTVISVILNRSIIISQACMSPSFPDWDKGLQRILQAMKGSDNDEKFITAYSRSFTYIDNNR